MPSILVLNGPNLNLLGERQPEIYGSIRLNEIEKMCRQRAQDHAFEIEFVQSNHEGELVECIQAAGQKHKGIVINPAAYSHTSIAIADALKSIELPTVEVHLSNIHKRETFRQHSYISLVSDGVICGLGANGYALAIEALVIIITKKNS